MITTTTETVPGRDIAEHLGIATGNTVRAKHVGRDIMAGFKTLVGGEIAGYTEMLSESRNQAIDRMVAQNQLIFDAFLNGTDRDGDGIVQFSEIEAGLAILWSGG